MTKKKIFLNLSCSKKILGKKDCWDLILVMVNKNMDEIDEKLRSKGWVFLGPILHYKKALKDQACVYKKQDEFLVAGIDSSGENDFYDPISKNEAEKRVKESLEEIKKHMFGHIE